MREWTERHIRELIDDEFKKLKKPSGADELVRNIDLYYMMPKFETGGYSIGGLSMYDWYFYKTNNPNIMRVEAPVTSPGRFLYEQVTSVYSYDNRRILGFLYSPVDNPPWYACPIYLSQKHYDDVSESGYESLQNKHYSGWVVEKWRPWDDTGELIDFPYVRLRDREGHLADFAAGVILADAYEVQERTEKMYGMRLGFIVPRDNSLTNWDNYDWNYSDYYYENLKGGYTNTICFDYHKNFVYAYSDDFLKSE